MRNKEGKSSVMILVLKGRIPLQTLQGSCIHDIAQARNLQAAVQERSQGNLLTLCKANPRLLHPVRLQQAMVLLMTFVLKPLLACKLNTLLSSATIQAFQGFIDLELFLALRLRWKEITTSKMWHLGRHARRKSTNMTIVKVLRGVFGVNSMKTFIPKW